MKKLVVVVAAVLALPAFAQTERVIQAPDVEVVAKETSVIFGDFEIKTEAPRPSLSMNFVRTQHVFSNLIKIRADFQPELQKSLDSL